MKLMLWMLFTILSTAGLALLFIKFFPARFHTAYGIVVAGYLLVCIFIGMRRKLSEEHNHHFH